MLARIQPVLTPKRQEIIDLPLRHVGRRQAGRKK